jgi:propionyl-CoA carboxylase beta chain
MSCGDNWWSSIGSASRGYVDAVIEPRETRPRLINALQMLRDKRDHNPVKKHGNMPL